MPTRPLSGCRWPRCPNRAIRRGYCEQHVKDYFKQDKQIRGSSVERGYDAQWDKIRAEVLRAAGIPQHLWQFCNVDHRPAYDRAREPDHRKYQLVPMLQGDHSAKTAREDGGFGHRRKDNVRRPAIVDSIDQVRRSIDDQHEPIIG